MIWVCHVCFRLSVGGVFNYIMQLYENIDRSKVQFAIIVQRDFEYDYDKTIRKMGGLVLYVSDLLLNKKQFNKDLTKIFKDHPEFKIVHCHMNYYNYYPLLIARKNGIQTRISHNHTTLFRFTLRERIKYCLFRHLIKKNATIQLSCSNKAGFDLYRKHYLVCKNGIDVASFAYNQHYRSYYRNLYKVDDGKIVIGHVSNFSAAKNIPYILNIFKKLDFNKYVLLLVGSGDKFDLINQMAARENIPVIFTGLSQDVNKIIQCVDIFLLPSLFEGLGISAIESQAAGIFTLCSTRVPNEVDCTDLIVHLPLEDESQWTNAIDLYKDNCNSRASYNKQVIEQGYDITDTSKEMLALYLGSSKYGTTIK